MSWETTPSPPSISRRFPAWKKAIISSSVSEDKVRRNLKADHWIVLNHLYKQYPNAVYLFVGERSVVATMQWLGIQYTLDIDGMILGEYVDMDYQGDVPTVYGFGVSSAAVGEALTLRASEQLVAYSSIVSELTIQRYEDQVISINVADPDSLSLLTAYGITVQLGNSDYMRAKIGDDENRYRLFAAIRRSQRHFGCYRAGRRQIQTGVNANEIQRNSRSIKTCPVLSAGYGRHFLPWQSTAGRFFGVSGQGAGPPDGRRCFLTNNSSKSAEAYVEKLKRMGVRDPFLRVLTSGQATAQYALKTFPGQRAFVLGTEPLRGELRAAGLHIDDQTPDYVLIGYDTTLDYQKMTRVCDLVRAGLPYIADAPGFQLPHRGRLRARYRRDHRVYRSQRRAQT